MSGTSVPLKRYTGSRKDLWWLSPLLTACALAGMAGYAAWAVVQDANYYVAPYLSPLYSPCLAESCLHPTASVFGSWWKASPAMLVLWVPIGLRVTCYYYRKTYYRAFFFSPPACAISDFPRRYSGESRFPLLLQNLHRYFFYLSLPILAFLWLDAVTAFTFYDGIGVGVGSLLLTVNATLLTLFAASCNSCRHACGGHVRSLHDSPVRHCVWKLVSRLNEHHREYAWISLFWVLFTDLYIRLLAVGALSDVRLV